MADWVMDLDRVDVTDRDGVSARLAAGSDEMRVDWVRQKEAWSECQRIPCRFPSFLPFHVYFRSLKPARPACVRHILLLLSLRHTPARAILAPPLRLHIPCDDDLAQNIRNRYTQRAQPSQHPVFIA